MDYNKPYVSIIIPTYHDWNRLLLCINALKKQTYAAAFFEVIIVNNDPEDRVPKEIELPDNFTILSEKASGSYAARNTGVKIAKGEIVGFTDSDCIPEPDWIEMAVNFFAKHPEFDRIGGKVNLFTLESKYTLTEAYETVFAFRQDAYVKNGVSVTANMFTRKRVLDTIGLFNAEMFSGGDFEWGKRAAQSNFKIGFSPDVIVNHPARRDLKQLLSKIKRVASGKYDLNKGKSVASRYMFFLYQIRPPFKEIRHIHTRGEKLNTRIKLLVFMLRYRIRVLKAYEEIKLINGSKPFRDV